MTGALRSANEKDELRLITGRARKLMEAQTLNPFAKIEIQILPRHPQGRRPDVAVCAKGENE